MRRDSGLTFTLRVFAQAAGQCRAQVVRSTDGRQHPGPYLPWWSVTDVLDVPALQLGHPVLLLILMEADNGPLRSHAWATARSHHALDRGLDMTSTTSRG
jgi:hypothetical protein